MLLDIVQAHWNFESKALSQEMSMCTCKFKGILNYDFGFYSTVTIT